MKTGIPFAALLLVTLAAGPSALDGSSQDQALAAANDQWAEGDYIPALHG